MPGSSLFSCLALSPVRLLLSHSLPLSPHDDGSSWKLFEVFIETFFGFLHEEETEKISLSHSSFCGGVVVVVVDISSVVYCSSRPS